MKCVGGLFKNLLIQVTLPDIETLHKKFNCKSFRRKYLIIVNKNKSLSECKHNRIPYQKLLSASTGLEYIEWIVEIKFDYSILIVLLD